MDDGWMMDGCIVSTFLHGGVQLCDLHCQQVDSLLQTVHPQVETVGLCEQLTKDVLRMTTCTSATTNPTKCCQQTAHTVLCLLITWSDVITVISDDISTH